MICDLIMAVVYKIKYFTGLTVPDVNITPYFPRQLALFANKFC